MWGLRNKLFLIIGIVMVIPGLSIALGLSPSNFMFLPILFIEAIGVFFILFAIYSRTKYKGSKL